MSEKIPYTIEELLAQKATLEAEGLDPSFIEMEILAKASAPIHRVENPHLPGTFFEIIGDPWMPKDKAAFLTREVLEEAMQKVVEEGRVPLQPEPIHPEDHRRACEYHGITDGNLTVSQYLEWLGSERQAPRG